MLGPPKVQDTMPAQSPKLTVAIPTYRGTQFLGDAMASVLRQTFQDFELLVINDNSPDDTEAVVHGFDDPRVRYVRNPGNLGPQGNWNRCLDLARGHYFKLLPHDDLLMPTCLARQVSVLDADRAEQVALVFSAREVLAPDGRVLMRRGYPGAGEGRIDGRDVMRSCVRRGTNLVGEPGAVMFRKALADRVGHFDATNPYVIDLDYWFRLLVHGGAYFCDETLASFRVSGGSWSVAIGRDQSRDFKAFTARFAGQGLLPVTAMDRLVGRFTPELNNLARLAFYRLYLR